MLDRTRNLVANALWLGCCLPDHIAFRRAASDVGQAQGRLLYRLLRDNSGTDYGRRYGFVGIRSIQEFQRQVPLTTYDDYRADVERIGLGESAVLTGETVRLLEPTGGSSGGTKLIPYTDRLKREFQRGIGSWIADLLLHHLDIWRGQAYWSVTPVTWRNRHTPAGIPIGFEEDTEYLGRVQQVLAGSLLAVPPAVKQIDDIEAFRYVTLLFLLRSRDLRLVSVWNPTFMTLLLQRLDDWWPALLRDIEDGTLTPPAKLAGAVHQRLTRHLAPDRARAAELQGIFVSPASRAVRHRRIWPALRLVSCWADGWARQDADVLATWLPQARIQPKGLLATEGIVSFPLVGMPGGALAIRSHFFEFLPEDDTTARPLLAHQLVRGPRYSVVLTNGGGLYRYRLEDLVEVVGAYRGCPLVRFAGKEARISDRFGEKLHEQHVAAAVAAACDRFGIQPDFSLVSCEHYPDGHAYTLFTSGAPGSQVDLSDLAADLDARLAENMHYRYCRDLGQLGPLRVIAAGPDARDRYQAECVARGQRLGDIKLALLDPQGGWLAVLVDNQMKQEVLAS